MQYPIALVISSDPVGSALLGAAVELARLEARFPLPGESARTALRRTHPIIVLADCDHDETSSDSFVGPALMTGARIGIFCSAGSTAGTHASAIASRPGLAYFTLPDDADALHAWLASVGDAARRASIDRGD